MTPETRACLRAMAVVRRWLQKEVDNDEARLMPWLYEKHRLATMRSCIEALHPARNPRLKAALCPIKKKNRTLRKGGDVK